MSKMLAAAAALVLALYPQATEARALRNSNTRLEAASDSGPSWTKCNKETMRKWEPQGDLQFIHIPRTMGTTIEGCSDFIPKDMKLSSWAPGAKKVPFWHPVKGYKPKDKFESFPSLYKDPSAYEATKCFVQHVPPASLVSQVPANISFPYKKGTNFCVVRHPYDRLISQFGFGTSMFKSGWGFKYTCNKEDLNSYLKESLEAIRDGPINFAGYQDCHFVPQSLYVYGVKPETWRANPDEKWCDHVLHYENLGPEFNELMEEKGYGVRIFQAQKGQTKLASQGVCATLTANDLTDEVKALANDLFKDDFELLKYKPL